MIKAVVMDICGVLVRPARIPFFSRVSDIVLEGGEGKGGTVNKALEKINRKKHLKFARKIIFRLHRMDGEAFSLARKLSGNYSLMSITNNAKDLWEYHRERAGLPEIFDYILVSYDAGFAKPDRRIYDAFLGKTGMEPGEILFIDHSRRNIGVAERLGMRTIRYENPLQLEKSLKGMGLQF